MSLLMGSKDHYMQMNEVARDLIEIFRNQRDNDGMFFDVTDLSFRWGLECEFNIFCGWFSQKLLQVLMINQNST